MSAKTTATPLSEIRSLADECLSASEDTDDAIECMHKKIKRRTRLHATLIEQAVAEEIRMASYRTRRTRRSRAKRGAAKYAGASEEEKQSMVDVAQELDAIWLHDFRLGAAHNVRLGLATKKDVTAQRGYNEEQAEGNHKTATFLAALEKRMTGNKTVEECLTGTQVQKIAENVGYV